MHLLWKGVTILLITAFTSCDISFTDVSEKCQVNLTQTCVHDVLNQILNIANQNLSLEDVKSYLNLIMNLTSRVMPDDPDDQNNLKSFASDLLTVNKNLVSTLVKQTDLYTNISFFFTNLEVQVFNAGRNFTLFETHTLITSYASMDINYWRTQYNNESLGVGFMSYTNMIDIFKPSFFDVFNSKHALMSAVVSVTLLNPTYSPYLRTDFTLKHIKELEPGAILSCMNWGPVYRSNCYIPKMNTTHTVCSCYYATTVALISETDPCMDNAVQYCERYFLYRLLDYINYNEQLPQETVKRYLTTTMKLTEHLKNQDVSEYYGHLLLYTNRKLVSKLVQKTDTYNFTSILLQNLEIQIFMVGPNATFSETRTVTTSHASLDIDLIGISKNNAGSASVAFISYTNTTVFFNPTLYDNTASKKTIISAVVSTAFPQTRYIYTTKPLKFTLKHINGINTISEGILSCESSDWNYRRWNTGLCTITNTNSTHTVCSCSYCPENLALFQLTMSCGDNAGRYCEQYFLQSLLYYINYIEQLPQETVKRYLTTTMNLTEHLKNQDVSEYYGHLLLYTNRILVSKMVQKTDTYNFTSILLQNLEIQIFMVGPNATFSETRTVTTSHASLDIDLIGISKNNAGSASVAFISYTNTTVFFNPTLYDNTASKKTIISAVVSTAFPQTRYIYTTKPLKFTLKHINGLNTISEGILSCESSDWYYRRWNTGLCTIANTNSTHTVCSCSYCPENLALFQLTMLCGTKECANNLLTQLDQLLNATDKPLPPSTVTLYLGTIMNITSNFDKSNDTKALTDYGNYVLAVSEKLVSRLVTPTETESRTNISVNNMEAQVYMVGKRTTLAEIPPLNTSGSSLYIDLIGISKNNNGSAAVIFVSYTNMADILKPSFFNTDSNSTKTLMSTVVSATLPQTTNRNLTNPVNFTFKYTNVLNPEGQLYCVYWRNTKWVTDGCNMTEKNNTHTICSCIHLSTFAVIMMIDPEQEKSDDLMDFMNTLLVSVGLLFLVLTIVTLAVCQRGPKVSNVALLNLCISLFLAHLSLLLTQKNLDNIKGSQLCVVLAGVIHFLFLSAFAWMFIEAVLLYTFVKNLLIITSKQHEVLNWKCMLVIGYTISLAVVGVTSGLYPGCYDDQKCWLRKNHTWSFLGPVCGILAINLLISCVNIYNLKRALVQLDKTVSHLKHTRTVLKTMLQFVILGCPWTLGFFADNNTMMKIVFLFLNSQQGTFIFIVHCILNQEIRQQYRKWWTVLCHCSKSKSLAED